jgi:superfamily II DNA or RNA helicase/HKD family nuclease/diadenosine tetraphosphate (Ap4A) HIT family hydrolase
MTSSPCPFCHPDPARVFYESPLVVGLWDAFPVGEGHALLVTRRHLETWFDATAEEHAALVEALAQARTVLLQAHRPDGFNIGVNVGAAGGQTIPHLHVHLIPRYAGDVPDPRGGVRHVIPAKGNYLAPATVSSRLVTGEDDPLLPHILEALATSIQVDIVVSFVMHSGVDRVFQHLQDLLLRGGRLRMLTGDYLGITEPDALSKLLDLRGEVDLRVFETGQRHGGATRPTVRSFHPKAYIFQRPDGGTAFVGSSNLSITAVTTAVEWNYRVVSSADRPGFDEVSRAFNALWVHPGTRVLTADWIDTYRAERPERPRSVPVDVDLEPEPPRGVPVPNAIQSEALQALQATREAGNKAGLVVLATGLGKTWLAAFDCDRPEFKKVLFVAHREEILDQARRTFRTIRSAAVLGTYNGQSQDEQADVLFASIQTLSRMEHLRRFSPIDFDYIVVDEFHHAAAASYRKLLAYFQPKFLLGLTATPERSDGGDLLTLCQQNLVFRCDLPEGVRRELLSPFHYFGVPDDVDYTNIPWRSARFDEEELTTAVATQRRAQNALDQLRTRGGKRAMGFCVSQRHAEFMTSFFQAYGLRAVAVHSGPTSAPRTLSLERLNNGELDIIFAVDMFNEGVDLPNLDTLLMLRPTESRILFLQQFGRGLRRAEGKERLTVIDYIGNHRIFLLKPQTLFELRDGDREVLHLLERLRDGSQELPPGCEVTYDLRAVDILRGLLRTERAQSDVLARHYDDFKTIHGVRPSAVEMYQEGYNPRAVRPTDGSWVRFVASKGDLNAEQAGAFERHRAFIESLDTTTMVRSYKMVVLLAMLNADRFPGEIGIDALADEVERFAGRTTRVADDLGVHLEDRRALVRSLEQNPIAAWTGGRGTGDVSYFVYESGMFRTKFDETEPGRGALQELVRELAEWRLAEYLDRAARGTAPHTTLKVSHSGGRPFLFLPSGAERDDLPNGWTPVTIDGHRFEANFVTVAVNVVREPGSEENALPAILRGWFGPDAGAPGTRHQVALRLQDGEWRISPDGVRRAELKLWQSYSREEIPALFGMEFSQAIWNVGYVSREGHIFLLVTLDKSGHAGEFQYGDRFVSPTEFQWQSQNRTTQASKDGVAISTHMSAGVPVHLFVRARKKQPRGGSMPFTYCGDVRFGRWEGERPITVWWTMPAAVPTTIMNGFTQPEG